jgi:hypothetical protein
MALLQSRLHAVAPEGQGGAGKSPAASPAKPRATSAPTSP